MTRGTALVGALIALVVLVAFYFLLWRPKSDEIQAAREQQEQVEAEAQQLRARIAGLEEIRRNAPEVEAAIVAAESVVPRDLAVPAALRQLVLAADESGTTLVAVNPTRPEQVEDAEPGLAAITFAMQASGGYYQLVDFLRRIEDPAISPRGVIWTSLNVAEAEEEGYPTLTATITGTMYALLPVPPEPAPTPTPSPGGEDGEADGEPAADETPGEGAAA
ncbi:MAG: type 4a pilus biogenesis protein PilO [Actinobacteria bacterium]|nr:type 4a pilus biogenesis protein PilO [Actinomycetota bacterium]